MLGFTHNTVHAEYRWPLRYDDWIISYQHPPFQKKNYLHVNMFRKMLREKKKTMKVINTNKYEQTMSDIVNIEYHTAL